jgi:4-amino-4-deoxy-L-arabinose transferase-like glycosyltransferase
MPFPYLSYGLHFLLFPLITLIPAGSFGAHADLEFVRVVLAARIVSALVSTGTVVLVYWLASRAYGRAAGLLAALITALAGLLIQLAHFATPDSTTLFLMTASLVLMYRFLVMPSSGRFAAAGYAVGLAAGSE